MQKQILEHGESFMLCELASYKTLCLHMDLHTKEKFGLILAEGKFQGPPPKNELVHSIYSLNMTGS